MDWVAAEFSFQRYMEKLLSRAGTTKDKADLLEKYITYILHVTHAHAPQIRCQTIGLQTVANVQIMPHQIHNIQLYTHFKATSFTEVEGATIV